MDRYLPRVADEVLKKRLASKGAVLIEGCKWCGKTTTAKQMARSVISMDQPNMQQQYARMVELDPSLLLKGDVPRLIDEWQLQPVLWNTIRYEVDERDAFGQFILTGSAVPAEFDPSMHTGTGRIAHMRMRPMSLFESEDSSGTVSLQELFQGNVSVAETDSHTLGDIAYLICRGGWPKALGTSSDIALQQAIDYFDAVVYSDVNRVDQVKRNPEKVKRLLWSYARNDASQCSLETIRRDIIGGEEGTFDQNTMYSYLEALKKIFVLEDSPAWNPNLRSKTAIRTGDTRYFTDPSVAAAALGAGPEDLINDLNTLGLLFENLCIRDLRVYADVLDGEVYHYRDKNGLECDAVLHRRNGTYALIEVKLGGDTLIEEGASNLIKLSRNIDTAKMKAPSFMMVLCAKSDFAYQRKDDVIVCPITCLRP